MIFFSAKRALAIFSLVLLAPLAWAAGTEPGGQGTLKDTTNSLRCFKPKSDYVEKVCAQYQINWKLWALMGEPVGNYVLSWKLDYIELKNRRLGAGTIFYWPTELPAELKKAAAAIELYIDGYAMVNLTPFRHRFNTGVAVRADSGNSYNVPGSPDWGNIFVTNSPCDTREAEKWPVAPNAAKDEFRKGISLHLMGLCPESGVSELSYLEDAIDRLCEKSGAAGKPSFCPKEEKKEQAKEQSPLPTVGASALDGASSGQPANGNLRRMLDESTERPLIQKRLQQEIARYRPIAAAACVGIMRDIDACYARSQCPRPAQPQNASEEDCKVALSGPPSAPFKLVLTAVRPPGWVCDADCIAEDRRIREAERREEERYQERKREWESKQGLKGVCQVHQDRLKQFRNCESMLLQACNNPKRMGTQDECVNEQLSSKGPTEQDARKIMQKEWEQRSRTGTSITNRILD